MRLRRPATLLVTALLPASLGLAACGSDDSELKGFDAVSVSGDVGEAPKIDWKGTLAAGKADTKVITEGDGDEIAKGDVVLMNFTIANGYTHKINYTTYLDDDGKDYNVGALVKVGAGGEPQSVADVLTQGVADAIKAGQKVGSRIAVTVGSDDLFGDYIGNGTVQQAMASMDIGNEDGLLVVADLTAKAGPVGAEQAAPAWAPKIVEKSGVPSSLDFAGTPAPTGKLLVSTLVKGSGPVVKSGQKILASYLGQIPKGKKPFDESYSTGRGLEAIIGGAQASVVKGWSQGLVGLPVGSRVLLQIPPALGYGKKAQDGIPANSTLYFVVDILDAADVKPVEVPTETPSPSGSPSSSPSSSPSGTPSSTPSE
ncbi:MULTISPECIES: FKBP-type peptidyl-prolyl cis-trans isomerase [unclassified Nocardioides]|uniref:FKBP-type peptidyl-prolyl cis-trans isomerase n=1 Tax=unclassified Nocardioides TaxID=2615069 RepID=UPI000AFBB55A|nr:MULTISPECIES: FKBP-type peptidyl-prolyl cis-trans isomerase [unclassified Nocardioides]